MERKDSLKKKNRICGGILGVCALVMLLIIGRMGPEMQPTQIEKILFGISTVLCFVMVYFVGKFKKAIDTLENSEEVEDEIEEIDEEYTNDEEDDEQ